MKVVGFRVDAATHIGTGHLQRCLTLARELQKMSISSIFFVREYDRSWLNLVADNGFLYHVIGQSLIEDISYDHSDWLGVSQEKDAEEFIKAITEYSISIVIIDHYSIDCIWEDIVKKTTSFPLIVIDDLANRSHNCELLVDQNYWPDLESRYERLVPRYCLQLLGPKYALLRDEFAFLRKSSTKKSLDNYKTILVNFGGVGNMDVWNIFLPALIKCSKFNFHVISGRLSSKDFNACRSMVESSKHILLVEHTEQMSYLMKTSDFALGACGSTVWERFCLGLDAALIDIADNQKDLVRYLNKQEMIDYLGSLVTIKTEDITNFILNLQLDSKYYQTRKVKIQALVDGLGSKRIASHIVEIINK